MTEITSTKNFSQIQWDSDGMLWVREEIVVTGGGVELARTYLRTSYAPGDNIPADAPQQLKDLIPIAWTPEVVAARKAKAAPKQQPEEE